MDLEMKEEVKNFAISLFDDLLRNLREDLLDSLNSFADDYGLDREQVINIVYETIKKERKVDFDRI